ncbi:MAG: 5-oxoprolinase subunit PxpB [Gemmatimonadota bacterium]
MEGNFQAGPGAAALAGAHAACAQWSVIPDEPDRAPRLRPLGDAAVLIEVADEVGDASHRAVNAASAALAGGADAVQLEVVPAYTTIAVHYDPQHFAHGGGSPYAQVCALIERLLREATRGEAMPVQTVEIPVRYGGADGPDLDDVARHADLDADSVVRLHAAGEYTVQMIGFVPGFPYLSGLPACLATPRRASPRLRVAPGTVGIAGVQTGIYPLETPGGWQLIGRTDVQLFRPDRDPPVLLRVGDRVRFVAVA